LCIYVIHCFSLSFTSLIIKVNKSPTCCYFWR